MELGAWYVRTLLDRDSTDADRSARRTALIASELKHYGVDIAAVRETID